MSEYNTDIIIKKLQFVPTAVPLFVNKVQHYAGVRTDEVVDHIRGQSKPNGKEMEVYSELLFIPIADIKKCYSKEEKEVND